MRKENILKEQQRNKLLEDSGVGQVTGADLICVDIQEEYQDGFTFDIRSFTNFLNENYKDMNSLTILFNGPTLGFPDEQEYKGWLMDNGLSEELYYEAKFYDKGYAFFRYCMDEGIDDDELVNLIQYMMQHDIHDSREIDEDMWKGFMQQFGYDESEIRDLLEVADDMIYIPDLMEELKGFSGKTVLCGGGINECLREVEISLMTLKKNYNILTKYVY